MKELISWPEVFCDALVLTLLQAYTFLHKNDSTKDIFVGVLKNLSEQVFRILSIIFISHLQ